MERKKTAVTNFLWRFAERCGAQAVTLVVSIVLARLLDPSVYGVVAIISAFTLILQVFVESGFGTALIQKKDADDLDFSSVFYFNLALSVIVYALIYFASPWIAAFYKMPELTALTRVSSLILIIAGVKNVQQAYVSRTMQFKRFFFATLGGTVGAAVVGIWMAYRGYGVWALVVQNLFNQAVDTVILWITVKWRPKRAFSWKRLKVLYSFGWKILAASLLSTIYDKLRHLLIGKFYTSADLGYFDNGNKYPEAVVNNINSAIDSVLFPMMSKEQDNVSEVKSMTRRAIMTETYVLSPLLLGLAACADTVVRLLLTEKWLPCVPYLRIFCVTYLFYPIHTANLNAIKALGNSAVFLKLDIYKKLIGLILLAISLPMGVMAMAYFYLIQSVTNQIINSWPNRRLLGYSYLEQLRDILPCLLLGLVMAAGVYAIGRLQMPLLLKLPAQILAGAAIYVGLSAVVKPEVYRTVLTIFKERRGIRK